MKNLSIGNLRGWDGGLDGGFELTRGNSETRNFRFAFRANRKLSRDELALYTESIYSIDDLPGARPHVTANEHRGGARFYHDFTSRVFAFANTEFMTDALQDLNLRTVLGGGALSETGQASTRPATKMMTAPVAALAIAAAMSLKVLLPAISRKARSPM